MNFPRLPLFPELGKILQHRCPLLRMKVLKEEMKSTGNWSINQSTNKSIRQSIEVSINQFERSSLMAECRKYRDKNLRFFHPFVSNKLSKALKALILIDSDMNFIWTLMIAIYYPVRKIHYNSERLRFVLIRTDKRMLSVNWIVR